MNLLEAETLAPLACSPWTLERCNVEGVTVKDSAGDVVLEQNFGDFPTEWGQGMIDRVAEKCQIQARFMVLLSQECPAIVNFPGCH